MTNSRLEKFIYAICGMDVDDLPTPLSRIEILWNCLITGEVPDFEPLSRNEKYLMAMLSGDIDGLPEPTSRGEKLLYKIATGETDLSDVPGYLSRYEELLKQLIENGGIGGTDFEYVLYTLNQPLSTLYSTAEDIVNTATIYGDTVVNTLQEPSDLAVTPIGENIDISNTTVNGTVEGKVKSAILKGNTIKNLTLNKDIKFKQAWSGGLGTQSSLSFNSARCSLEVDVEPNTTYSIYSTMELYIRQATVDYTIIVENDAWTAGFRQLTTTTNANKLLISARKSDNSSYTDIQEAYGNIIVKGDYIIDDYFEDLKSVRMPVLTTTGKNLFDGKIEKSSIDVTTGSITPNVTSSWSATNYINVKNINSLYFQTSQLSNMNIVYMCFDENKNFIGYKGFYNSLTGIITPLNNTHYIRLRLPSDIDVSTTQIEQGTQATSYEPYKTNILSCDEEVTLRGIGDVKDTLDLTTGELTQRIGEVVLDGSEDWRINGTAESIVSVAMTLDSQSNGFNNLISDKFTLGVGDIERIAMDENNLYLRIQKSKLISPDISGVKNWLSQNPTTVNYILKYSVTKTVDLSIIDQDGNETSHLHTFNDTTHISTSAECLLPNVVIPADISYPSIIKANTLYTVKLKRPVANGNLLINLGGTEQLVTSDCFTIQTPATLTSQNVIFSGKGNVISEVTVVEGDRTEKEYGYFEGMMSVKMPVLTTHSKNFYDNTTAYVEGVYKQNVTNVLNIEPNTTYTFYANDKNWVEAILYNKTGVQVRKVGGTNTTKLITFTTTDEEVKVKLTFLHGNNTVIQEVDFTGIQLEKSDTKSPYEPYKSNILTATSKNLFDMNRPYDNLTDSQATVVQDTNQITVSSAESGIYVNANFILDKDFFAGKTVTGSCLYESDENDIGTVQIAYQDGNGEHHYQWIKTPKTFTFPNSFIGDVMLSVSANNTDTPQSNTVTVKNIQLELGSTATSYEPYSEGVTLRGIGEVKDTLDGNTGELTQRICEVVLDGDITGYQDTNHSVNGYSAFRVTSIANIPNELRNVICDKVKYYPNINLNWTKQEEFFTSNGKLLFVKILSTKASNFEEFRSFLSSSPITIQYKLETPTIKPVGLSITDQDGQPTKLSTFNDITHVSIEAEDLLPTVDLEVPTKIEETLSSLPTQMNDISETQHSLNEKIDAQAENINEVSTAMAEIRNDIL